MSSNPAVLTSLMPGANISGNSVAVPSSASSNPSIGGSSNPFLLPVPSGQSSMPLTTPAMPANTVGSTGTSTGLGGTNIYSGLWGGGQNKQGIIKALKGTGIPGGIASLLAEFMMSGAGFNPQVAQALINAMQPQVERGTENIMEQFSAMGNRFGSPAAVGLGDFESQVNLNMDQIFSQLYEDSVQNYLSILMGAGKKKPGFGDTFAQSFGGSLGSGLGSFLTGS
jgi:hypothetical protein